MLPAQEGQLLLACEGMHPGLVEEDPWFAGWSGVLVNLSDIAAHLEMPEGQWRAVAGVQTELSAGPMDLPGWGYVIAKREGE